MTGSISFAGSGYLAADGLDAGTFTIGAAAPRVPDIAFHSGPNETRFTAKGMVHRGALVEDAGAVHALLMAILSGKPLPPPAADASPFPDRDPDRSAEQQGLFRKFDVRRTDRSDAPGGKHHGCRYFVIDMDHDQYAGQAMRAYAAASAATHPKLAEDLRGQFGADENDVIVDRRDLFDQLRAAWRDGQDHHGQMGEDERWAKASDHAQALIRGWPTLEEAGSYARAWHLVGVDTSVSDLSGSALDFWVAKANGATPVWRSEAGSDGKAGCWLVDGYPFRPSSDWGQCGPLIDKFNVGVDLAYRGTACGAWILNCHHESDDPDYTGETRLIAACRAIVGSVYGSLVTASAPV